MSSLRKRVSSYFRQLSFHNDPKENRNNMNENSFVTKYLQGRIPFKEGPTVLYGKNPTDLPNYDLASYEMGQENIVGSYTGPNGGLTTVKRTEKHLSITDPDIDYIDTQDETSIVETSSTTASTTTIATSKSPTKNVSAPIDNTTMVIKVAGQTYYVTNKKKQHSKSHSLGSLSEFNIDLNRDSRKYSSTSDDNKNGINQGITINNNNIVDNERCDNVKETDGDEVENLISEIRESESILNETIPTIGTSTNCSVNGVEDKGKNFGLAKSRSEGNPFNHKRKGKIIKLTERPTAVIDGEDGTFTRTNDHLLPDEWNVKSNYVYGLSDSLYDKNQVTKCKNGDPIADCFGVIARTDSAVLALADGVNWGEKAAIAAKSAIHGCLHYLDKTIFNDTKPFRNLIKNQNDSVQNIHDSNTSITEHRINNTREVFVCLLRAFNCAHDLILENEGMLTTLTVAVVLPLSKSSNNRRLFDKYAKKPSNNHATNSVKDEIYVCCVCNVGDTLAYVYSQDYGIRELTKGSHDISSNRDMRDALGALGPVDGINPELNNLTLSITVLEKGDIVMIASDGLTDNFDPNVCKFSVNLPESKKKPSTQHSQQQQHQHHHAHKERSHVQHDRSHSAYTTDARHKNPTDTALTEKAKPPAKPPRKNIKNRDSTSRSSSERNSDRDSIERSTNKKNRPDNNNETFNNNKEEDGEEEETVSINSALIAQFLQENPVDNSSSSSNCSNEPKKSTLDSKKPLSSQKQTSSSSQRYANQLKPRSSQSLQQKSMHSMPQNRKTTPSSAGSDVKSKTSKKVEKIKSTPQKYTFLRSKTSLDMKTKPIIRNDEGIPFVMPMQRYELTLLLMEDILKRGISGNDTRCVTAKKLCESLLSFTFSITSAKRRTLEDAEYYYENNNGILVEVSAQEKKIRRRRGLEKVQNLPGKLDHVSVVACNVGNISI